MGLLVVFQLDEHLYGLEGAPVEQVVPLVDLLPVPHAPEYVCGIFNLHGRVVPVIDMCRLLANRAARSVMSTRVVVVEFPCADGQTRDLGLVAESILEIRSVESATFDEPVIRSEDAPYLGPILKDGSKLIQVIELPRLLPESLQATLFAAGGPAE